MKMPRKASGKGKAAVEVAPVVEAPPPVPEPTPVTEVAPVAEAAPAPKKRKAGKAKAKKATAKRQALVSAAGGEQLLEKPNVKVVYIEQNAEAAATKPQVRIVERVEHKRKTVNLNATFQKYRERLEKERTPEEWKSLNKKWLSDYKLYSDKDTAWHYGTVLLAAAKAKGVTPSGLCAENCKSVEQTQPDGTTVKQRAYVQATLPDGSARDKAETVYIGGCSRFTDKEASIWSLQPGDKVYV